MARERVPRRPMSQLERARAQALVFLHLKPASDSGKFVTFLAARATEKEPTITEREATALTRLCCFLRERLAARGDAKLVPDTIISEDPPQDGRDWDSQCARCGSSTTPVECEMCAGEGHTPPGELHEEDPLYYDEDETHPCSTCFGRDGWRRCLSSEDWCKANPRPGREHIEWSTIEWFVDPRPEASAP